MTRLAPLIFGASLAGRLRRNQNARGRSALSLRTGLVLLHAHQPVCPRHRRRRRQRPDRSRGRRRRAAPQLRRCRGGGGAGAVRSSSWAGRIAGDLRRQARAPRRRVDRVPAVDHERLHARHVVRPRRHLEPVAVRRERRPGGRVRRHQPGHLFVPAHRLRSGGRQQLHHRGGGEHGLRAQRLR